MMEKVMFENSRCQSLIGNFYTSNSELIVIMSHGFTGDKSEWGRFNKIAKMLNDSGYNVLTFDFSGCGESEDDTLTVKKQVDDLKSAIRFVKLKGYKKIGLFGHSLGGLISLKCFTREVVTMVLFAPVTDKIKCAWDKKYSEEQLKELNEKGYITKIRNKGVRKKILIDKQMLEDRENINQDKLLKDVKCPILIIHGKEDESVPPTDSVEAVKLLSEESKLELIDNADHSSYGSMEIIAKLINNWFLDNLKV